MPEERKAEMTGEAPLVESSGWEEMTQQIARCRDIGQTEQLIE